MSILHQRNKKDYFVHVKSSLTYKFGTSPRNCVMKTERMVHESFPVKPPELTHTHTHTNTHTHTLGKIGLKENFLILI